MQWNLMALFPLKPLLVSVSINIKKIYRQSSGSDCICLLLIHIHRLNHKRWHQNKIRLTKNSTILCSAALHLLVVMSIPKSDDCCIWYPQASNVYLPAIHGNRSFRFQDYLEPKRHLNFRDS